MLTEVLETRIMIKRAMKKTDDEIMYKILDARQLSLKMLSNVMYGYTAAGYSGRMPCVDLADSIVQLWRETLERVTFFVLKKAIRIVEKGKWGAKVIYGDTDSLFVLLKGKSKADAFKIGSEIAKEVTKSNPKPIKLVFEKVYHPCVLMTKKRYVGYSYENETKGPRFESKGIETVRRDSCPIVSQILETSLKLLFETRDISKIKNYVKNELQSLINETTNIKNFIFSKEVKIGTYSENGTLPPSAMIAKKLMKIDINNEPLYKERVPYLVVFKEPNSRLIDMVVDPKTYLKTKNMRLHYVYYISKQIFPSLGRVFQLIGVDVKAWEKELDINQKLFFKDPNRMNVIDSYFITKTCLKCNKLMIDKSRMKFCVKCDENEILENYWNVLCEKQINKDIEDLNKICFNCVGVNCSDIINKCESIDCKILFKLKKIKN
jgi:DNA polymerase zeta